MKDLALMSIIGGLFLGCAKGGARPVPGVRFDLYPAVEGAAGEKNCRDYFGRCIVFQTEKPVLALSGFGFKPVPRPSVLERNRIEISLDKEQALALRRVTKLYGGEGKRLAVVYNGKVLHAPKIRGELAASDVVLDYCNPHLYEIVLAALRGEIPPDYDFNKDKVCGVCEPSPPASATPGGTAYYYGKAYFFSPDGQKSFGKTASLVKRTVRPSEGRIVEAVLQPGREPGRRPKERVATMLRIPGTNRFAGTDEERTFSGEEDFEGAALRKWTYDVRRKDGSRLTGAGWLDREGIKTVKTFSDPKGAAVALWKEDLRVIGPEDYRRRRLEILRGGDDGTLR